jgi:hypothetical protein
MVAADFTCFNMSVEGAIDLCFFGGVCNENGTSCDCPVGYGHDFVGFHSSNCALPDMVLEIFAGIYSIFWLLELIWLYLRTRNLSKPYVIHLAKVCLVFHLSLEVSVIGIATQRGMFEVLLIGYIVAFFSGTVLMDLITRQLLEFTETVFTEKKKQMKKWFSAALMLDGFVLSVFGIGALATCRLSGPWYDVMCSLFMGIHFLVSDVFALTAWHYTSEFLKILRSEGTQRHLESGIAEDLVTRMQHMRKKFLVLVMNLSIFVPCVVATRYSLGSFPFLWVMNLVTLTFSLFGTAGIISLLPPVKTESSSKSSNIPSKDNKPSAVNVAIVSSTT